MRNSDVSNAGRGGGWCRLDRPDSAPAAALRLSLVRPGQGCRHSR